MSSRVWEILVSSFSKILIPGIQVTIPLTILSFALALVLGTMTALVQYANVKVLRKIARFYIWIIRGTPLLVQLFILFYGLPKLGILIPAFPCAILGFGLNEGAYMAESIRASLESVPSGQLEAGACVGLTYMQTIRRIVLPQALRIAFPPLSNHFISMLKGTSLASVVTITEMFRAAQLVNARVYQPLALYCEVALIYLIFCTVLTWLQGICEKKLGSYGGVK